jgi:DNA-binding winged helix-turn-helix (wHTH) protein
MNEEFSFGSFHLFPSKRILRKSGKVVSLGSRAFNMLVAMAKRHGDVLTPEELMAIAWPGVTVEDSNMRVQIANLRRALGPGSDGASYIANVAGRGYCFVVPVTQIEPANDTTLAIKMWCLAAPLFLELGLVRECRRALVCATTVARRPCHCFPSRPTRMLPRSRIHRTARQREEAAVVSVQRALPPRQECIPDAHVATPSTKGKV